MSDREAYIKSEFGELAGSTEFKLKIIGDNGETKWLAIAPDAVLQVYAAASGQLSAAIDTLRSAVETWEKSDDPDAGIITIEGNKLAEVAGGVLDLLTKASR